MNRKSDLTLEDVKPMIDIVPLCAQCDNIENFFINRYQLDKTQAPSENFEMVNNLFEQGLIVDYEHDLLKYWASLRNIVNKLELEYIS